MVKNTDWASEREWRMVALMWDPPDDQIDQPLYVPLADALIGVVLGEAYPDPHDAGSGEADWCG